MDPQRLASAVDAVQILNCLHHGPSELSSGQQQRAGTRRLALRRIVDFEISVFAGLVHAARTSTNPFNFALVRMLGLLRLRILEATGWM